MRKALPLAVIVTLAACNGGGDEPVFDEVNLSVTITHIGEAYTFGDSGSFNTPDGTGSPGPIGPGGAYTFEFDAGLGGHLSLATMYVQSNDWVLAAQDIALYDGRDPVSGDYSASLALWDAGTEADQESGLGADQAPRQAAVNTGEADPDTTVRAVTGLDPAAFATLAITHVEGTRFSATLTNISVAGDIVASDDSTHDVLLSPGTFAVHGAAGAMLPAGEPASAGLEALAEDGDPSVHGAEMAEATGVTVPLANPFWVVSDQPFELYESGMADYGLGLETLAEDGSAADLDLTYDGNEEVAAFGQVQQPDSQVEYEPAPVLPGEAFTIDITVPADPDLRLHAVWMYAQSNDVFFGFPDDGVQLFDESGNLLVGDVAGLALWDAGTEMNQAPGIGPDQAPRQATPNSGEADADTAVRPVDDGFEYGDPNAIVSVNIRGDL